MVFYLSLRLAPRCLASTLVRGFTVCHARSYESGYAISVGNAPVPPDFLPNYTAFFSLQYIFNESFVYTDLWHCDCEDVYIRRPVESKGERLHRFSPIARTPSENAGRALRLKFTILKHLMRESTNWGLAEVIFNQWVFNSEEWTSSIQKSFQNFDPGLSRVYWSDHAKSWTYMYLCNGWR